MSPTESRLIAMLHTQTRCFQETEVAARPSKKTGRRGRKGRRQIKEEHVPVIPSVARVIIGNKNKTFVNIRENVSLVLSDGYVKLII